MCRLGIVLTDTVTISFARAVELVSSAFFRAGVPRPVSASVAEALVTAEAEGQIGHGIIRLADYIEQVRSQRINVNANISVVSRGAASLYVDADFGFAYPAIDEALARGLPIAQELGICVIAIGNSHHCGALSFHVERIAAAGLIGLMFANTPKAIAPWGSRDAVFGTNPIAFSAPRLGSHPLVIDLSLSRVARGKVMAAKKSGDKIPLGWALDCHGNPTTEPDDALAGSMIPIGGAKGTALALMVEILAAVFSESALSVEAGSFFDAAGLPPKVGQALIAIRPASERTFASRLEQLLEIISSQEGARLPGTRRQQALSNAHKNGLEVPRSLISVAQDLATGAPSENKRPLKPL
ncbi:MAG: Ldh family oxidoreductase [Aestuariivita sp.]|nr:Ldh family oxidoreductase [Aestuariivita sp.]